MDNYKIKVKDEAECKEAQELFKQLGFKEEGITDIGLPCYLATWDGGYADYYIDSLSEGKKREELTLPQLRDLVAAKNKTVREFLEPQEDGTYKYVEWTCLTCPPEDYIEIPEGAEFYMQMRVGLKAGCQFFFKFDDEDLRVLSGSGWQHASYDSIQEYVDKGDQLLWSRETVKKDPALISGADAMTAAIDGKDVEYEWIEGSGNWRSFNDEEWTVEDLKSGGYRFRLKPTTLTVNAELPKPQKETQHNSLVFAVTYEFKTREERNAFADKLRGTNS